MLVPRRPLLRPRYVVGRGWPGVRLDGDRDSHELPAICADAYRTVARPKLVERVTDSA